MSGWFKNILFVSYLKNKGVRRLCFIIGCIFLFLMIITTPKVYDNIRINKEYNNINDVKRWVDVYYHTDPGKSLALVECTSEYFAERGIENIKYSLYSDAPIEWYCLVEDKKSCSIFQTYADKKIKLDCGKKEIFIYRPLAALLSFYLPFILAIMLKFLWAILFWIYNGFKESRKG